MQIVLLKYPFLVHANYKHLIWFILRIFKFFSRRSTEAETGILKPKGSTVAKEKLPFNKRKSGVGPGFQKQPAENRFGKGKDSEYKENEKETDREQTCSKHNIFQNKHGRCYNAK